MNRFRNIITTFFISTLFTFCLVFTSCENIIGYGVLLWNVPEYNLSDGLIVPVYIKSNISHVYVIENPETKEKIEIPLWKLTPPEKLSKAKKTALLYTDYQKKYAMCVLDGLPIRAERVNTSKQVYRLRKNEIVRTLYQGKGAKPTNGKTELEGEWLKVLTKDGTSGWCFSYNLRLFEMNADGSYGTGAEEAQIQKADETLENLMKTKWYPDYYSSIKKSLNMDLNALNTEYGFDTGEKSETVKLYLPTIQVSYPYKGVTKKEDYVYSFNETSIEVTVKNQKSISVQYTNERGMPKTFNFISMDEDFNVDKIINDEINRRETLYRDLIKAGPDFRSSNYGVLTFSENNSFQWTNYSKIIPSVISKFMGKNGKVKIQYFIPSSLKENWDGVITFIFDGHDEEINLLYKKEENGLRLTKANVTKNYNENTGRTSVSVTQSSSSLVLFFQK